MSSDAEVNIGEEIARLRAKSRALTHQYLREPDAVADRAAGAPSAAPVHARLRRHDLRAISRSCTATACTRDDLAIVGGLARLDGRPVMLIGHQKGRDTKERVRRNYGMPKPEGYRKALRLMKLAERFRLPIVTLIDTPGAYPGVGSEERNQSEAIARNLFEMSRLRVPVVTAVIGEGGSGGALAIGVCDRLLMLQYAVYSVISPEGCASILWKSADKKELAAEAMGITAERLDEARPRRRGPEGAARRGAPRPAGDGGFAQGGAVAPPRRSRGAHGGRTPRPALPAVTRPGRLPGGQLTRHLPGRCAAIARVYAADIRARSGGLRACCRHSAARAGAGSHARPLPAWRCASAQSARAGTLRRVERRTRFHRAPRRAREPA